jgi:arsenate reductase (thioredoxin)
MARPFRVLIVCTGNSARSQMAEALLATRGAGRFASESAGAQPAGRVSRRAVAALAELGIDWSGKSPRGLAGLEQQAWDLVITVCDSARQACPLFTGARAVAHWDLPDPMDALGTEEEVREAFRRSRDTIAALIERLIALPVEVLPPQSLVRQVNALGVELVRR